MSINSTTTTQHQSLLLCARLLVTFFLMVASECVWAGTRTDVITKNIEGAYSAYSDVTFSGSASTASYKGNLTGGTATLKLKSSNNSGIVSTTSGGRLKSVTVVWNSNANDGVTLEVYGKTSEYTGTSVLYGSSKGTKKGELVKGNGTTTLTISGDYAYVGLRAKDGSSVCFFDEIRIEWESDDYVDESTKTVTQTTFSDGLDSHTALLGETFTAPTAVVTETATGDEVTGATITYESSVPSVAAVNATSGTVSILKAGTTIITASYAGDDTYEASSATYTLQVEPFALFTWDATQQGYGNGDRLTTVTGVDAPVQLAFSIGEGVTAPAYSTDANKAVCFYSGNTLMVSVPEGYAINSIVFSFCDKYAYNFVANVGTFTLGDKEGTWTGFSPYVTLKNITGVLSNFTSITVSYVRLTEVGEVTVKSVGVATYCPVGQSVVVGDGTKTYIYTGLEENGTTLKEAAQPVVPAGTGVMIGGIQGEAVTYKLYSSDDLTATASADNLLVGVTEANTRVPSNSYVLQNGSIGLAFYYVDESVNITMGAGKAYLKGDPNQVKAALYFRGGGKPDPTAISDVLSQDSPVEAIYNMQGIRQNTMQHGLNIIRLTNGQTIKRILP